MNAPGRTLPQVRCQTCERAGYRVAGEVGVCPYDADVDDVMDCPHDCCAACRRDCAESL